MLEPQDSLLEKKSIRELPNEILLTIFSYLQIQDIKYCVSKVCNQWANLAKDKKLWKYLTFKTTNKSTKTFGTGSWYSSLRFLENTPQLQNVIISQGHTEDEISEILKAVNDYCPNLRHIDFDTDITPVLRHIKNFPDISTRVESLKLTLGCSHSQANVFKMLSDFKSLKKLTFLGSNPESFGFRLLLKDCPLLENIDVVGVDFSKGNYTTLLKFKEKFTSLALKTDKLDGSSLNLLNTFPNIKDIVLSEGNTSPEKLSSIGKLSTLSSLHLQEPASSPVLTATALIDFFRDGCFINLKELKLHKSRLDDEGAAEIRKKCVHLMYLEVMTYPRSRSSLTQKALLHFLHCKQLQHFEILFDSSQEEDWIYRRIRYVHHDCDVDGTCSLGLEHLLESWDEVQIPVD